MSPIKVIWWFIRYLQEYIPGRILFKVNTIFLLSKSWFERVYFPLKLSSLQDNNMTITKSVIINSFIDQPKKSYVLIYCFCKIKKYIHCISQDLSLECEVSGKFLPVSTPKLLSCSYQTPHRDCPNTKRCQISSDMTDVGGDGLCFSRASDRQSRTVVLILPPAQTPSSSVIMAVAGERGLPHPVWGCINSILVFPNCCLYQVLNLRLTSEPLSADRYFLLKTTIVSSVLSVLSIATYSPHSWVIHCIVVQF